MITFALLASCLQGRPWKQKSDVRHSADTSLARLWVHSAYFFWPLLFFHDVSVPFRFLSDIQTAETITDRVHLNISNFTTVHWDSSLLPQQWRSGAWVSGYEVRSNCFTAAVLENIIITKILKTIPNLNMDRSSARLFPCALVRTVVPHSCYL